MNSILRLSRFDVVALLLATVQSVAFTQLPLLNILGLEFSLASAPLLTLLSGLAACRSIFADGQTVGRLLSVLLIPFLRSLMYAVPPLLISTLNAFFVRNCSLVEGLAYYFLVVPPAMFYGVSLAALSFSLIPSFSRSTFVVAWSLTLAHVPFVTFTGAQIFAFNPILGYFPGFSYDESLPVMSSLAVFRLATILASAAILGVACVAFRWKVEGGRPQKPALFVLIASLSVLGGLWWMADEMMWGSSLERISKELGGMKETEHFVIMYPSERVSPEQLERLAREHEFTFERLRRTLRVMPAKKVIVVLYASSEQKSRLVGGGRTNFAKPWLWQLHLLLEDMPGVLRHELTHVLAADFGFSLLRIGTNAGAIEGLAVAMERQAFGESLHRAAAQALSTGPDVEMSKVFSLAGFFRSSSSVSYTLAGSFCRYLIEQFGIRAFKTFYRTGDTRQAFLHDFPDLVHSWRRRIDAIPLSRADSLKARYFYTRPPMHTKECLRVLANLNAETRSALMRRDDSLAVVLAEKSWRMAQTPESASLFVQSLVRRGRYSEAIAAVEDARQTERMEWAVQPLGIWEGDAWWRQDSLIRASEAYRRVIDANLSVGWNEAATLRWEFLVACGWERNIVDVLLAPRPDSAKRREYEQLLGEKNRPVVDALLRYALARITPLDTTARRIRELLGQPLPGLPPVLLYIAKRRLAEAFLRTGEVEHAKAALWESLNHTESEVESAEVSERIHFCEWLRRRNPALEPSDGVH